MSLSAHIADLINILAAMDGIRI